MPLWKCSVPERRHGPVAVFLRGAAMGIADLVPGVSGGTVAFITGIYERLLAALSTATSPLIWMLLLRGKFRLFWKSTDANFVAALAAGVLAAILLGAGPVRYLLHNHTALLLAFFSGLTLAAAAYVLRGIRPFTARHAMFALVGVLACLPLSLAAPLSQAVPPSTTGFFLAGALALCAMILPGISGSFLLLMIGMYPHLLDAVHLREAVPLAAFAAGGAVGLLVMARFLNFLMGLFRNSLIALLCGIMLGALPKLWPWRATADGSAAIYQPPAAPWDAEMTNLSAVGACFAAGIALVIALELAAQTLRRR